MKSYFDQPFQLMFGLKIMIVLVTDDVKIFLRNSIDISFKS